MQKNNITKSFEQIQTMMLPNNIAQIVTALAREVRRFTRGRSLDPEQLEATYAMLHMRVYQRYGSISEEVMKHARTELERLLGDEDFPCSRMGSFRNAFSARFL